MNDSRTSTAEIGRPLTPPDCDLRDFAFMPLDVVRLRDSDLAVTAEADEFRCAVLLWCASWHQVPAASLPDDDKVLAQYAGYGRVVKEWLKVRDGAMRGWVKCSDGRLYHTVVAEKANEAWTAKLRQRLKTECARIKKHNERHGTSIQFPEFDAWLSAGCPVGQPLPVPSDKPKVSRRHAGGVTGENHSKGQGEGQGQGQLSSKTPSSSSQASTEVGAGQQPDDDRHGKRETEIASLLRQHGLDAHPTDSFVRTTWAPDLRVTDDVLLTAIAKAKKFKPDEDIPLAYLDKAVQSVLQRQTAPAAPIAATVPPAPPRKPQGLDPKGTDESYEEWQARVTAYELAQRSGGRAA
jgi:hypothetical protein